MTNPKPPSWKVSLMKRLVLAVATALAMSAMSPAPILAQGGFDPDVLDELAADIHQVPLTEDMIDRFVASYPEMKAVAAKFPVTEGQDDQSELEAMPPEKRKAMEEVATKHGFKDLEDWIAVTNTVAMSYAYVREGKNKKDLDAMVANAVAQAEADQKLTSEQREKAIQTFRALGAKLAKLQPLPQNTELVEKMIGKVAPVMKIQ